MPLTAYLLHRLGWPEGEAMRNKIEAIGNIVIAVAILLLIALTLLGLSGFVKNGWATALLGVTLAVLDGVFFTLLLVYCQRLDRSGVAPGAVFGLRFPLYVLTAGLLAASSMEASEVPEPVFLGVPVAIGFALIVPPLYALQRAVALVSTMTLGAVTAAGPFVIFALQIFEGRVEQSGLTLLGLCVYFFGATLGAIGAVRATLR